MKIQKKKKFEDHLMLLLCCMKKGCSKSCFLNKGILMNQYTYLKECIQKRVMSFIKQYHTYNNCIFWLDQARAHYAKSVINYLNKNNVNFVHKIDNPVNVPECHPIENFWAILKQQVYKKNWRAKNVKQLYQRIQYCLNKLDMSIVQLFSSVKSRLGTVRRRGVSKLDKCFKQNYNEALKKLFLNFSFILKIERVMSFQTLSHFLVVTCSK